MDNLANRISEYCNATNIDENMFYKEIGMTHGSTPSVRNMRNIEKIYPDLNLDWLMSGIGDMRNSQFVGKVKSSLSRQERFKELVDELGKRGVITSQKNLAAKLGYNKSYFSHLVNQRDFPNEMCVKLKKIMPDLNIEYLLSGYGTLILKDKNSVPEISCNNDIITFIDEALMEIRNHGEEIAKQGNRIDAMIELMKSIITSKTMQDPCN